MFGLGSLLSGGVTGVLGSIISNVTDYFEQRRKNQQEIKLRELDIQEMQQEYEARKEITAKETDASTQEASYKHDARSYSKGLKIKNMWLKVLLVSGDFVRASVRPALTLFLIYLVWDTRMEVQAIINQAGMDKISPKEAISIYASTVEMIMFLASTAVTWWFGTRPRKAKKQD